MPYTVASPSPVPLPTPLVVKNGSNRCACTSGLMPLPVSHTLSIACGPPDAPGCISTNASSKSTLPVSMVRRPPWGIASRAFTARFRMICSICAGSAFTRPSAGSSRLSTSIVSPISGLSIWAMPATTPLRSSTRGWSICWRLKARSCWVSDAARSAVFLTSSTSRRWRVVGGQPQQQELRPARDDGQEIVEVVRDAAGELADRFHLLDLSELRLALPERLLRARALGDVEHGRLDGRLARPDDLGDLDLDPDLRAVAPRRLQLVPRRDRLAAKPRGAVTLEPRQVFRREPAPYPGRPAHRRGRGRASARTQD